jgi:hypothetical protein
VAKHFKSPSVEDSGFSVLCPFDGKTFESLRVFGVSNTGEARALVVPPAPYQRAGSR